MPRRKRFIFKAFLPLGLLAVAVLALVRRRGDDWEYEQAELVTEEAPTAPQVTRRRPAARFAYAAAFTTLFFAGASFTAGAGDQTARLMDEDAAALAELGDVAAGVEHDDRGRSGRGRSGRGRSRSRPLRSRPPRSRPLRSRPFRSRPSRLSPQSPLRSLQPPEAAAAESVAAASDTAFAQAAPAQEAASNLVAPAPATPTRRQSRGQAGRRRQAGDAADTDEAVGREARRSRRPPSSPRSSTGYGEPTVWLNRALPDPTPASARLARSFARDLAAASKRHGADWAAVLGVLRAQGNRDSVPATSAELDTLASRLAGEDAWKGALAVSGRTAFADRAEALADLYRSVGIEALVTGLEAAKDRLAKQLLADEHVWIYGSRP